MRCRKGDVLTSMEHSLKNVGIGIIGGGKFCRQLLELLYRDRLEHCRPRILGIADLDDQAEGMVFARRKGIFTTGDYRDLYRIKDLQVVFELTKQDTFVDVLRSNKPQDVTLIDHLEAASIWDQLVIEDARLAAKEMLARSAGDTATIEEAFDRYARSLEEVVTSRSRHYHRIKEALVERGKFRAQIIQGSTVPTFVIDSNHIVTHWNGACENLTGYTAEEMVGTDRHWVPFWPAKRPTMADTVLEDVDGDTLQRLYGSTWRASALIEGAYEAEAFFPPLGKWIFFTAAPIKGPDGIIIGAITTLQDKTEDRKAEQERELYTRELSALCSIYSALGTSRELEQGLCAAVEETSKFLSADAFCIYLMQADGTFRLKHSYGISKEICGQCATADRRGMLRRVVETGKLAFFDDITTSDREVHRLLAQEGITSLVYIPIAAKENKVFGTIRIGTREHQEITSRDRDVLELVGNRIGLALENSMLQEQIRDSEEKYRSLFENDPNPIFIVDSDSCSILDTNQRACDCYGYTKEELLGMSFLAIGDERDDEIALGLRDLAPHRSIFFPKRRHYRKGHVPFYANVNVCRTEYSDRDVLIATTTDITESVEKETQLIQASKMTTLGIMAAGMAHEINQPLNVIQVCADFILKVLNKGDTLEKRDLVSLGKDISDNVQRAAGIIKHMRDFSRQSDAVKTKVCINRPIRDVFNVLGQQLRVHQIRVELELDAHIPYIMAEHNRLEQVFINLVTNAIDAMDEKGKLRGTDPWERVLTIRSYVEHGRVTAVVSDTGTGIPEEMRHKIFEPFFTTKEVGKGTGLGISISYGIVKDYDGTIDVDSTPGEGTTFTLTFPACE